MNRTAWKCGTWCAALIVAAGGTAFADDKPAVTATATVKKAEAGAYSVTIQLPDGGTVVTGAPPQTITRTVTVVKSGGEFWVGLNCQPVTGALRSQLSLPKGVGLVVADVVAGSPAAKAGLKQYDVLVRFGKSELKSIGDLSKAVEKAKEKTVSVVILRGGKKQTVKVTPAKRGDKAGVFKVGELHHLLLKKGLPPNVAFKLEKAGLNKQGVYQFRLVGPGIAFAPEAKKGKRIAIRIQKADGKKAVIVVTRDGKTWKATEGNLEKLPKDIRVKVEKALKGGKGVGAGKFEFDFKLDGKKIGPGSHNVWVQRFPGGAAAWAMKPMMFPHMPPMPPFAARAHGRGIAVFQAGHGPLEKKLDEINKKLDALQKAIESLKKK